MQPPCRVNGSPHSGHLSDVGATIGFSFSLICWHNVHPLLVNSLIVREIISGHDKPSTCWPFALAN